MFSFLFRGDFRHFYSENISDFSILPSAWDSSLNTGIGISQLGSLWITSYLNFTSFFHNLGLSFPIINLFFWILPAAVLSFISPFLLFRALFPEVKIQYAILSGLIYSINSYFLMIFLGGQLGVSMAYSLAPLVLLSFIKLLDKPGIRQSLTAGLMIAVQLIFDPRIVYLTIFLVLFYYVFNFDRVKILKNKFLLIAPFLIALLLNAYWILPLILLGKSPLPEGFGSSMGLNFFSFADFSHTFSLLHPNFPENIFGKTYFLRPEFLLLPIVAFSSLSFVSNKTIKQSNNRIVLFFSTLALIGIFLAKGANEPFGFINTFIFENFPGMSVFRDPTKFYLLIALSYSVLIPLSLFKISAFINSKVKSQKSKLQFKIQNFTPNLILLFAICYLLFAIRPLWLGVYPDGSPRGEQRLLLRKVEIPKDYIALKDFLYSQKDFFRTLWIPQWQRFGYFSNNHPAIGREEILKGDYLNQIKSLDKVETELRLQDLSVKYIIIPYDSEGEIFLTERTYDEAVYRDAAARLEKINYLRRLEGFGKIDVFETNFHKDHFWSTSETLKISYQFRNSSKYEVFIQDAKEGDVLVFSEGFDSGWVARDSDVSLKSSEFNRLNSFKLTKDGDYELEVYYKPQEWVNIGLVLSGATLVLSVGYMFKRRKK